MKKKSNKNMTKITLIVLFIMVILVGYYAYLVNRSKEERQEQQLTAVQEVLLRDMTYSYPPTPKEVIKYHNEIDKCLYNEKCTTADIEALVQRDRELYDADLLAINEWGAHVINITKEIEGFRKDSKKLTACAVGASTDVFYFEEDGYSFARIPCNYTVLKGTDYVTTMHIYLLRKDEVGHWKIYGWTLAENVNITQEE